jgi:hypothetical protein
MRMGGSHDAHMQHMRKRNVAGEPAAPGDERPVFQARY